MAFDERSSVLCCLRPRSSDNASTCLKTRAPAPGLVQNSDVDESKPPLFIGREEHELSLSSTLQPMVTAGGDDGMGLLVGRGGLLVLPSVLVVKRVWVPNGLTVCISYPTGLVENGALPACCSSTSPTCRVDGLEGRVTTALFGRLFVPPM